MAPGLASYMKGKKSVILNLPGPALDPGTRIFFVEVADPGAARTGCARLFRVADRTADSTVLEATWGWSQGKIDDDLKFLGLDVGPERFSALTIANVVVQD